MGSTGPRLAEELPSMLDLMHQRPTMRCVRLRVEARSGEEPPCSEASASIAIVFGPQGHAEHHRAWFLEVRTFPRRIEGHRVTLTSVASEPLAVIEDAI